MNNIKKVQLVKQGNRVVFARIAKRRYGLDVTGRQYYIVDREKGFNKYSEALAYAKQI